MTDIEVVQWFFDLEKVMAGFNWPVNVRSMADAKRSLDVAIGGKSPAGDVLEAYKKFAVSVGPTAMNMLLQSDDAFPEINHSGKATPPSPGLVTLYVAPDGGRVVARTTDLWGAAPEFSIL